MVVNHFKTISELKNHVKESFRNSIIPLMTLNNVVNSFMDTTITEEAQEREDKTKPIPFHRVASIVTQILKLKERALKNKRRQIKTSPEFRAEICKYEEKAMQLSPGCENRITCILDDEVTFYSLIILNQFFL